jgi:hypothetical protein
MLKEIVRKLIFISTNIGDKESSSDLETGAEPHRLELEEEFGEFLQEVPLYPLLSRGSGMKWSESLQGATERSEGVFYSALRKFKYLILGGKRALFAYFFLKSKIYFLRM